MIKKQKEDLNQKSKRLHLKMTFKKRIPLKGFISKRLYTNKMNKKLVSLGLVDSVIKIHSEKHLEIEATGDKNKLWEMVKWTKNPPLYYKVQEVHFQFVDLVDAIVS